MSILERAKPLSKTSQISVELRRLVEEVGPDGKLPTYSVLLKSLGVSRTTLNAALDDLENQRLIYRRHGVGIYAAAAQKQSTIALVCDPLFFKGATHSPFWDLLLRGARERAEADDLSCEVHFCKSHGVKKLPFSENLKSALQMGHVQGVIGVGMNKAVDAWLRERRINYVSFGGPGPYYVGNDNISMIRQGVQLLAEAGCRRIALFAAMAPFLPHSLIDPWWNTRLELFRMALEHQGLPFDAQLLKLNVDLIQNAEAMTTVSNQEQGHQAAREIFQNVSMEPADGVLILDDLMTVGALAALRELEIQPSRDVQIVTHSNRGTTILSPYHNSLTRLEIDPAQLVDIMFSTMHELMEGNQPKGYVSSSDGLNQRALVAPTVRRSGESDD